MTPRVWTLAYIGFVLLVMIGAYDVYVALLNDGVGDTISNVWASLADWWPPIMLWFGIAGGHMGTHAEPYLDTPAARWFMLAWCTVVATVLSRAGYIGNGRWSVVGLITVGAVLGATLLSQSTSYTISL